MSFQDKIRDKKCKLCPLHGGAQHVCLMGSGTKRARLMIIGEAPGEREDDEHAAFVGPSGQLLTELLREVGISRSEVYITNVAKCRPPGNRTPDRKEIKTCVETYLWREWDKVQPEFVLVLGNAALQGVLGKSGITKHRGTPIEFRGATVLPAFHPAYALRQPRMLPALKADMQRLRRLIDDEESPAGKTVIKTIRTPAHLKWLLRKLRDAKEFSFDVETHLNKEVKPTRYFEYWEEGFRIVSIAFTLEEGTSYVVPLYHAESPWHDPARILRYLRPYLERGVGRGDIGEHDPLKAARVVAHNGKFDVQALASYGIRVRLTFDTMLAAHMLDENRLKGLKPLSEIDLAADGYKIQTDDKRIDYFNTPWSQVATYNGKDTDYTLRLSHLFRKDLLGEGNRRTLRVFQKLMMPASDMLVKVERRGIYIDPERLEERTAIAHKNLARIRGFIQDSGAGPINLNSPQQVGRWLFGKKKDGGLGLPILELTKSKSPSTREAVILRLARDYPNVRALLLYRKWAKYESTYLRPWAERRDRHSRYHTSYKLFGTVTGRLSGDFQQVPRDSFIRSIVGAPPGWKLVAADFSQIELRIAAMLADERNMLRVFHEGGDLHLATAINVSGLREEDITSELRKKAKPVNFGFLYGMGWKKFIAYAFENYGVFFNDAEAYRVRQRFFEAYPQLLVWHDRQRRLAHKFGMVYSPIGRARHLPDVHSQDKGVAAEAERQAINSPVQSCASDLMLMSMLLLEPKLRPNKAFIVATVHDEILFQVRDEALDEVCPLIQRTMERDVLVAVRKKFGADITVPIEAEVSYGQHWDKVAMTKWTG